MFIESVRFQRKENSNWERGFYIGRCYNDDLYKGIYLDSNYQPLERNKEGFQVWDMKYDSHTDVRLNIPVKGEF